MREGIPPYSKMWEPLVSKDTDLGKTFIDRYAAALNEVRSATNPAHRVNAETRLKDAMAQASSLYEDIHSGRKIAFSKIGSGYSDYNNYRWQSGKRSGIVPALKKIKEISDLHQKAEQQGTYGMELPTASQLIRRTATRR